MQEIRSVAGAKGEEVAPSERIEGIGGPSRSSGDSGHVEARIVGVGIAGARIGLDDVVGFLKSTPWILAGSKRSLPSFVSSGN